MKSNADENIMKENSWDLSVMYQTLSDWEEDLKKIDAVLEKVNAFKGKLAFDSDNVLNAYKALDDLFFTLEKVYTYAHLRSDLDIGNSENLALLNRASAKYAEISGAVAWFEPEILAMSETRLQELIKEPVLAFYKRSLKETLRDKPHTLSASEEKLLGLASDIFSTPEKVFSALNNVDINFPDVQDGDGTTTTLSHALYSKLLENPDRALRRNTFNAMYDTFEKYKNILAATLEACVKSHVFNSRIRKFPSALQASLHNDNVNQLVYDNLISAVKDNLSEFKKYLKIRADILNIDDLNMFDLHCPLVKEDKVDIPWSEACQMVGNAVQLFGDEYHSVANKAFSENWIDVYEKKGKRSGAYSSGSYDSPPYMLMNYNGTLNDVFTLAHELGHSMHSYYSNKNQKFHYASYKIFVAEVASITNELVLHDYLMRTSDDASFKRLLLNHLANEIRGTVFRQTMFAEFEKNIHDDLEKGIPLTADSLSEKYYNLNAEYHPGINEPDEKIMFEWARIPHFYYNFYVYKYATGFSAAAALAKGIVSGDEDKINAYLNFLKAGSSRDVLDILKSAGVDMATPEPVNDALKLFENTITKFRNSCPEPCFVRK